MPFPGAHLKPSLADCTVGSLFSTSLSKGSLDLQERSQGQTGLEYLPPFPPPATYKPTGQASLSWRPLCLGRPLTCGVLFFLDVGFFCFVLCFGRGS